MSQTVVSKTSKLSRDPERCRAETGAAQRKWRPCWPAAALPLALFAGTLAVYVRTLRPSFNWLDNSELITAAYHLGIGHNPGYPTFVIIGHIFSWLPIGSIAYRLNLMAAVLGSLAVVLLFMLCLRVTRSRVASALAALTIAFSYTFWDLTTEAEVYTLHACFVLAALLLLLRWRDAGSERSLYAAWFVVGVSLGNHALTALMIPALATLVVMERGWRHLWPRRILACAGALLAGAAVYLYIPLRAMANPPPQVNNPHNLKAFWQLLTARGCRQLMFCMGAVEVALRGLGFLRHSVRELGPLGMAAALLGASIALRADRKLSICLALLLALDVFYAINYDIFDIYTYFLPAYLVLAIFMAVGLRRILPWGEKVLRWLQMGRQQALTPRRRVALVAALLTYLPAWVFGANFALVDASNDREAEDFARNAFEVVEPGSVIIGDWWSIAPLGYLKYVEGLRPDVTLTVALSSHHFGEVKRVLSKDFLRQYPAAYVAEHQTNWRHTFKRRYQYEHVGDLLRIYPDGKPPLRASARDGAVAWRFGPALGLVETRCEPRSVAQGRILRITHRWKKLAPVNGEIETLTRIEGAEGCIWRMRSCPGNGFYSADTWLPGQVAEDLHTAFIPSDAPPGRYRVVVRARSVATGQHLPVFTADGAAPAAEGVTAFVKVTPRAPRPTSGTFAQRHWRRGGVGRDAGERAKQPLAQRTARP